MLNPDKYLPIVWQKGGRVYPDLDCFGIVSEVREDLGLPLWPNFSGVTKDDGSLDREAVKPIRSLEKCDPCVGTSAACYSGSTVTHAGVVVEINSQLHVAECNPGMNTTFPPVSHFKRHFVRAEFWKWQSEFTPLTYLVNRLKRVNTVPSRFTNG